LINILSFTHPHTESLFKEGLWGFPEDKLGINKKKWDKLEVGNEVLVYGEFRGVKGVWMLCLIEDKKENREPVRYWVQNPTGYPWQVKLRPIFPIDEFSRDKLETVEPVVKDELQLLGIKMFRQKADRWSLLLFGEGETYERSYFDKILSEFRSRNERLKLDRPDHDLVKRIIYQIGKIQNRFPEVEYQIENRKIDVVWRKTPKSVPSVAFEVQFGGNIFEALSKLKHAFDLWNAIPVLITTKEQFDDAKRWVEGSFHEMKDVFRILTWKDVEEYYEVKQRIKEFERMIKLF